MSAKTHTQDTETYFGTDLTTGMTWVDGYGHHYLITEVRSAVVASIVDGFISQAVDHTKVTLALRPVSSAPSVQVTVDAADEFDILKTA